MESSILDDLVSICELHGRFVLHKEAYESSDGSVTFNDKAKNLLFFTSNTVVNALQLLFSSSSSNQRPPFSDPNISSIHLDRSFAETSLSSPQSPNPMWRPRRRINRNRTPQRLDGGVGIYQHSPDDSVSTNYSITFQQSVIGPLFINVCRLFTEWLTVSPCTQTASFISQAAMEWCPKIFTGTKTATSLMDLHDTIVPPYLRMIGQLLKIPGNCEVLKEVLNTISDDVRSIEALQKVLSMTLVPKTSQLILNEIVNCFLNVSYECLSVELDTVSVELPDAFDDDWTIPKRSLSALLLAIMSYQHASNTLANNLIERFGSHTQGTVFNKAAAFFTIQCMWLLISNTLVCKISADVSEAIIATVQQAASSDLNDESLKLLVEDFLSKVK
jgi:hypothetical protein